MLKPGALSLEDEISNIGNYDEQEKKIRFYSLCKTSFPIW